MRSARARWGVCVAVLGCLVASAFTWNSSRALFAATTTNGTNSLSTGSLAAPTGVTATASGSTVTVNWTGPTGSVTGFYVQRYSGSTPSPACGTSPGSLLSAASTNCSDSSVADGTYTYRVTAVFAGWTAQSAPSNAVVVSSLDHFLVSAPASTTAGAALTASVTAKDVSNTTITTYSGTVHFASSDPGSPVLPGDYTFVGADNGTHTFTNGVTLKTASSQSITVNDTVDTAKTGTTTVTVNAASASQLAFTTQPGGGTAATAWSTQPVVKVQDSFGNTVTSSSASVTLAIGTNPGGGTLTCTTNPLTATSGVASFAGCKIDKSGNGYTLTATSAGLTSATSAAFNVTAGAATKLVFTQQPGGGTGGTAFATQPVVTVEDANGNTVTGSSASITVARTSGTGTSGATLTCTTSPLAASSGVASFAGCRIDKSGNNYTITATAAGLTSAVSSTFNVIVGPPAQVGFTQQPSVVLANDVIAPSVVVAVQDAGGNTVTTSSATITMAIGTNPGGGTLGGTLSVAAVSGLATFSNLTIDTSAAGYTLSASSAGLTSSTSSSFNINLYKLVFTQQPGGGTGGTAFAIQPVVTVEDRFGATVTGSSASITVARTSGTGTSGATLTCTTSPLAASSGVASFAGCRIDKAGNNYTITATAPGLLSSAVSSAFNVTVGPAAQLAFTQQPSTSVHGVAFGTQPIITVQDAGGNTVTTSSAAVTMAIGTNPGGGTLTCTTNPVTASSGVASFAGCKINNAGSGYRLSASSAGLTSATSNTFNIT